MKKVISFSLWGNLPIYCKGAIENVKLQKVLYPDWGCRFYIDESVPINIVSKLNDLGSELIYMFDGLSNFKKLFWRMLVISDKSVDKFLIRDCDSRLNIREVNAVKEWEESGLDFHIMRDNRCHGNLIMGGMWGGNNGKIDDLINGIPNYIEYRKNMVSNNGYNLDQIFLGEMVWPRIQNISLAHIGLESIRKTEKDRIFSTPLNGFVGQVYDENNIPQPDTRVNPLI
jgi:hypothetical protein